MKIPIHFLSILCALVVPLGAAEFAPSQVPASANWLAHADFDALRGSETGREVFAQIQAGHAGKLAELERMFGLDPLKDVAGVTMFGDGTAGHAVALINGAFDRAHLEDVFHGAANYLPASHAGFIIHSWDDKGLRQHAAFGSNTLLVFSRQEAALREALDVLAANAPVAGDPFFATTVGKPLVLARANMGKIARPKGGANAKMLDLISVMQISASEENGRFALRMAATTPTVEDAERLRLLANGMVVLAQTANPKFEGINLISEMTSIENPPSVAATLSMPLADWLVLFNKTMAPPQR
jgi:hypothetical protein